MSNQQSDVLRKIEDYYTRKLHEHGPTHRGVDWNSTESQELRFAQVLKICDASGYFTLNDYGCGYGALAGYALDRYSSISYTGYDVSEEMIEAAQSRFAGNGHCRFTSRAGEVECADYTVASGIFSVKMDVSNSVWEQYIEETLDRIAGVSKTGFSFNLLTAYSDPERRRPDLYYADPHKFFDFCRSRYSRNIALLHDYGLFEFTILLRL